MILNDLSERSFSSYFDMIEDWLIDSFNKLEKANIEAEKFDEYSKQIREECKELETALSRYYHDIHVYAKYSNSFKSFDMYYEDDPGKTYTNLVVCSDEFKEDFVYRVSLPIEIDNKKFVRNFRRRMQRRNYSE